jgi:Carbohydrate binding domain
LVLLLLVAACVDPKGFPCSTSDVCVRAGVQGLCEPAGACSFPDPSCDSGRRFGAEERAAIAGKCVALGGGAIDAGTIDAAVVTPDAAAIDAGTLPATNLFANPGFEVDTAGWDTFMSTLVRTAGGHSGGFHVAVCSQGAVAYTIDDEDSTVASAPAGTTYVAAVWVRLPSGQPAQDLTLKVRERAAATLISEATVTATTDWQEIRVMRTTTQANAEVDVFVGNDGASGGCFDADDFFLGVP